MSDSVIFDTHRFVKHMTEAGMASPVAEALAEEQVQLLEHKLATKTDLALIQAKIEELHAATKMDIELSRAATATDIANIQREIERSKNDLTWRLLGILIAIAGLIIAAIKLL